MENRAVRQNISKERNYRLVTRVIPNYDPNYVAELLLTLLTYSPKVRVRVGSC